MKIPITPQRLFLDIEVEKETVISSIQGLRLVERREPINDKGEGIQCAVYICRRVGPMNWDFSYEVPMLCRGWKEVSQSRKGDIAIYLGGKEASREQVHIGEVVENQRIISKWGYTHVYEHQLSLVPGVYGDEVRFFRR